MHSATCRLFTHCTHNKKVREEDAKSCRDKGAVNGNALVVHEPHRRPRKESFTIIFFNRLHRHNWRPTWGACRLLAHEFWSSAASTGSAALPAGSRRTNGPSRFFVTTSCLAALLDETEQVFLLCATNGVADFWRPVPARCMTRKRCAKHRSDGMSSVCCGLLVLGPLRIALAVVWVGRAFYALRRPQVVRLTKQ